MASKVHTHNYLKQFEMGAHGNWSYTTEMVLKLRILTMRTWWAVY